MLRNGRVVYFVHPVFEQYQISAPRWCKQLVANALALLLPRPLIVHDGPTTLRIAVNAQRNPARWVLHCLHYIPERRCETMDVLEDVIPVFDVGIRVRTDSRVSGVRLVPSGDALEYTPAQDGSIAFRVPVVKGHQMIEITLA